MTIKAKLHLSFTIFILSLLIPIMVGLNAISSIRAHQDLMMQISDLSFSQAEMTGAISRIQSVHSLAELTRLKQQVTDIQNKFSQMVTPLKTIVSPIFQTYADAVISDEQQFDRLASALFTTRSALLASEQQLKQQLLNHHQTTPRFLADLKLSEDVAVIQTLTEINNLASYALFNGMKEMDVNRWLEAIAQLKQQLLDMPELADQRPLIEQQLQQRREFVVTMVAATRQKDQLQQQEDRLINEFSAMVEETIQHGQHSKHRLVDAVEATEQQAMRVKALALAAMLILGVALSSYLTKSIANSINNMKAAVNRISTGDLDIQMVEQGNNEFSALADAVNHMTAELQKARQDMASYNQRLEQEITLRTHELKAAVATVEKNNRALEKLSAQLSKYLSPQLYHSIFTGKQDVLLETSRKKLTVFFSDIQGFTQLTDTMDPEAMTMILNVYLDAMTQIALSHGGTVDKFIGDAVMVFFGDPETLGAQQDALSCVKMAIAMQEKMIELKSYWQQQGYKVPFHIRIGINSGYCTVGNFGANDRMDYTIIGGNVNLASRLESQAKPDQILISAETYQLVKAHIHCQQGDVITVKGIAKPVQTYAALHAYVPDDQSQRINEHQPGFDISIDLNGIDKDSVRHQLASIIARLDEVVI